MIENDYSINFQAQHQPFNCLMVLPLPLLQRLAPIIKDSILKGLVDSDQSGRVILKLNLDAVLIFQVEKVIHEYESEDYSARRRYRA